MAKRSSKRLRIGPLQEVELVPVTDPAERADLERQLRDREEVVTAFGVQDLYLQLSAQAQLELLTQLAAKLPLPQQRQLAEGLLSRLSPEALQPLEGLIRSGSGKQ